MTGLRRNRKLDGIEDGAQVNDGYSQAESDGRYLRIDAGAPDQTRVSGEATFAELTTHASGVEVTGGDDSIVNGITTNDNNDRLYIRSNSANTFRIANGLNYLLANTENAQMATGAGGNPAVFQSEYKGTGHPSSQQITGFLANWASDTGAGRNICFKANYTVQQTTADSQVIGYLSAINNQTAPGQCYSFFSAGNAPNFFKGDTYIGGDTSRNTFELWQSTLTEEQLEQFEAGTLAAPANVSLPGDGEFARQWWYNQQDAETQALLDSGELDYPEHLAAATFTDTFALGQNTLINLMSTTGTGHFKGDIFVKNKLCVNIDPSVATSRLHVRHGSQSVLRGVNTNDFGSSNLDLVGGRSAANVGAGFASDLGSLNFYNTRGNSSLIDKENNAKKAAAIHAYSQSNDVATNAAGVLAFAVAPKGIDPNTGECLSNQKILQSLTRMAHSLFAIGTITLHTGLLLTPKRVKQRRF